MPCTLQGRLGLLTLWIRPKLTQQAFHCLTYRLICERSACFRRLISRIVQTRGDSSELGVRRTDIICQFRMHAECPIQLWQHAPQVGRFFLVRELMQRLRNRLQLLIAC